MNILIYGAGAVGGYVGGQLALAGHQVTLLARGAMAEALATQGLTLKLASGKVHILADGSTFRITSSTEEAFKDIDFDFLVFTMKAYDTVAAIRELEALTNQPPPILCLQGGVGNEASLAAAFAAERVVSGVLTSRVRVVEPDMPGMPGMIHEEAAHGIALYGGTAAAQSMLGALRQTGLQVQTVSNSAALKWSKLLVKQPGAVTSAILDMHPADIFSNADLFALERAALRETLRVMRAQNIPPINLPGLAGRTLTRQVRRLPARLLQAALRSRARQADTISLLHSDLLQGRRGSEVIWLNGAVARAGDALDMPAPVNHALALTLMDIVQGRAQWQQFQGHPEMLLAAVRIAI